jgi:hypothetical protein
MFSHPKKLTMVDPAANAVDAPSPWTHVQFETSIVSQCKPMVVRHEWTRRFRLQPIGRLSYK